MMGRCRHGGQLQGKGEREEMSWQVRKWKEAVVTKGHQMYRLCHWSRGNREDATVTERLVHG